MISRPIVFDIVYIPRKCSLENYNHILFFFKANRLVVVLISRNTNSKIIRHFENINFISFFLPIINIFKNINNSFLSKKFSTFQ